MKKTLLTLGTVAFLASSSLFAMENNLQEHLRIGQMLQKQEQMRLKNGSGEKYQYKYQHQNQYQYNGTNPNRSSMGSMGGLRSGGRR
jgi:hypothetical protein